MKLETRETIIKIMGSIILMGFIILFIYIMSIFLNRIWKTTCENRRWDKWKYTGILGWCLIKTKQGYIPEDRLYNLNSLENNWK